MAQGTIALESFYPGLARAQGAAPGAAVQASGGAMSNANGNAPTIAWLGVLVALVLLRVLYEAGAKVD